VIGAYLLISLIGEGGMGEVWLAEQKAPVRRRVAIKIIKPGMNTREVAARFAAERQTLALMNHPGIAQMFDTGLPAMDGPTSPWNMSPGLRSHTIATNTLSPRGRELGGLSVE
jgi:non-specific serine/threonine protein kinase/serine/threonine-protein kinase